jgi:hypothetical protein
MTVLRRAWQAWKRIGKKIGDFQARVLLTIFYFVILAPFGFGMRAADPLGLRKSGDPAWRPRPPAPGGDLLARARRQS